MILGAMAAYEEITVTLPDGYKAYGRYWSDLSPRGAVLYQHGIQSHCDWYESSAAWLADAGYAVLQVDRRGCGRNPQERGHADSADQLIADALVARDELQRRSGHSAYHAVGVSWGGKLVVRSYIADPTGVRSLTLVTPGLFPLVGVSKSEMAEIGMAMIYEPQQRFDIPLDDAEYFTADPRWQAFINDDALTLHQCSAGFYLASRRMDKPIAKLGQCEPVAVHLFLAGDERIIDNGKTATFIDDLNWPNTKTTTYDSSRHSLEFEGDPTVYYRDLLAFVDRAQTALPADSRFTTSKTRSDPPS